MSAPRPAPPEGYATWMDYHLEGPNSVHDGWRFARAELAELRKERDELREAMLVLGKLWFVGEYLESDSEVLRHTDMQRHKAVYQHNAVVAKLRAEKGEEAARGGLVSPSAPPPAWVDKEAKP